jgi:hypothetical protein
MQGELLPVAHIGCRSLVVNMHALYSSPTSTVTFGKVATYSTIFDPAAGFVVDGAKVVRLEEGGTSASVSKNLALMLLRR